MASEPLTRCDFESKDLLVKVDLTLPGDVNAISPVVAKVMAIVTEMGCAAGREFEIELALREALANAIEHGSGHDPVQAGAVLRRLRPRARHADRRARSRARASTRPRSRARRWAVNLFSTGGRGIYLINQLMDEVRFEKGGTEIHMRTKPPGDNVAAAPLAPRSLSLPRRKPPPSLRSGDYLRRERMREWSLKHVASLPLHP